MKTIALIVAAAAALFVSAPAAAQAPVEGHAVVIPTTGLDLNTVSGRNALDARIRAAAFAACEPSPTDLRALNRAGRCRTDLIAAAQARRDTMLASRGSGSGTLLAARR